MKKLFKPIAVFFSAALLLTSCIDNEVSDQVNRIREAQVNLLNAQVAFQEAQTAYQEAETRFRNAQAEQEEIQADRDLVQLERDQALAEYYVAQQEYLLQVEIDKLNDFLRENGLADAAEYLANYKAYTDSVFNTAQEIAEKEAAIARLYYYDELATTAPTLALLREKIERDLASEESNLAVQEAALASLEAAIGQDSIEIKNEIAELETEIATLEQEIDVLKVDTASLENEKAALADVLEDLEKTISDYGKYEDSVATFEADSAIKAATLALKNVDLTNANNALSDAEQLLANYTGPLAASFGAFNTQKNLAEDLLQTIKDETGELDVLLAQDAAAATITAARGAVNTAIGQFELVVGETNINADAYAAGDFDTFIASLEAFITAPVADSPLEVAASSYGPVAAYFDNAGDEAYDLIAEIGEYNADLFLGQFESAGNLAGVPALATPTPFGLLDDVLVAEAAVETAQDNLDEVVEDLDRVQAGLADLQEAYDDAVAGLAAAEAAVDAKDAEIQAIHDQITDLNTEKGNLSDVKFALESSLDNASAIYKAINAKKDEIEGTKDAIADLEILLADVDVDEAQITAMIAKEEAKLAALEEVLAGYEAAAAAWLALFEEEVG